MGYQFRIALAAAASALAFAAAPAGAAIVYDSQVTFSSQGFGNANRLITLQHAGTESGCVGVSAGGAFVGGSGACIADALVHNGNNVTNTGGSEVSPLADNQKYGIPTIGEMGWKNAANIGLLFNAIEPSGDAINVLDVTLKFYNGGTFLGAIDGQQSFASTIPGNGKSDYAFTVDAAGQAYLNSLIFAQQGFENYRIALETKLSGAAGGPESWNAVNLRTVGVPEPATWGMMILGIGMMGGVMRRRQRQAISYNVA